MKTVLDLKEGDIVWRILFDNFDRVVSSTKETVIEYKRIEKESVVHFQRVQEYISIKTIDFHETVHVYKVVPKQYSNGWIVDSDYNSACNIYWDKEAALEIVSDNLFSIEKTYKKIIDRINEDE